MSHAQGGAGRLLGLVAGGRFVLRDLTLFPVITNVLLIVAGAPSVTGEVAVNKDDLRASDGFTATAAAHAPRRKFSLTTPHGATVTFGAPAASHAAPAPTTEVHALHVTSGGELALYGGTGGVAHVSHVADGTVRRTLHGHRGDVTAGLFFPSDQVALTAATDLRLKIWALATGDCAATLAGHTRRVSAVMAVDRGRNILSAAWDGTVRLWDCGTQQQLATVVDVPGARFTAMAAVMDTAALARVDGLAAVCEPRKDGPWRSRTIGRPLHLLYHFLVR